MDINLGSIFESFEDFFGILTGSWPQPPKHLPLRILDLSGDSSAEEIKKAYRIKLLEAHPDLQPAFENPEYREIAQEGRKDMPDIQELVWARDCALRKAFKPVTTTSGITMGHVASVTPRREYFDSKAGEPRVCWLCGKVLKPERPTPKYRAQTVYCDPCIEKEEKENEKNKYWSRYHQRCPGCGVWTSAGWLTSRYCSDECRRSVEATRGRERRKRRRADRVCLTCGEKFTPGRSDGKYCSSACRQRAYRVAKAGKVLR